MQQHFQTACEPCFGFLGQLVDLVYLHALLGLLVYSLPLLRYLHYGLPDQLRHKLFRRALRVPA